ncbi:hypothetical protein F5Y04DRAFT_240701 [Hypomontagnella monticulosa]|nr:hypothetical protein F5Y04DRAFT_240701 [Hypomontagnella monticulosa]
MEHFCVGGGNEHGRRTMTSRGDYGSRNYTFRESIRNFLPVLRRSTDNRRAIPKSLEAPASESLKQRHGTKPPKVLPSPIGEEGGETSETTQQTFVPFPPLPLEIYSPDHGRMSAEEIIDHQRQQIDALRRQLREADDDLQRIRPERRHHISDDYLLRLWDNLKYKIQTHINQRFTAKSGKWSLDPFYGLTNQAYRYMDNPITRLKLFEAIVWKFLVENVFSLDGLVWAGFEHEHFKYVSCRFLGYVKARLLSREDYNAWRATSAAMFCSPNRNTQEEEDRITRLEVKLNQQLQRSQIYGYDVKNQPNIWEIIADAVEIDMLMKKSRAEYQVYMYQPIEYRDFRMVPDTTTYGFEFNPVTDEENVMTVTGTDHRQVQLVVSPVLLKKGTAEGNLYNHRLVISKRNVLCD